MIGCNTGRDCKYFIDFGAAKVHGVDVVEQIGLDVRHEKVLYHREAAEDMSLPDSYLTWSTVLRRWNTFRV